MSLSGGGLTAERVSVLVGERFPLFAGARVSVLGRGWDYDAFLLQAADGTDWVFRFPQRHQVVGRLRREIAWLPHIGRALSGLIRVPEYRCLAKPGAEFPHPFVGYPLLPGRPLFDVCGARLPALQAARRLGRDVAEVFRILHGVDPGAVDGAEFPDDVGTPGSWYEDVSRSRSALLEALPRDLAGDCANWLNRIRIPAASTGPARLVHDDLGSVHVLVDDALRLTGIIDFGDLDLGDPAIDLAYVTCWLGTHGTRALLDGYGADVAFAERVRVAGALLAMSWIIECVEIFDEPPQDFHVQWVRTALAVAEER